MHRIANLDSYYPNKTGKNLPVGPALSRTNRWLVLEVSRTSYIHAQSRAQGNGDPHSKSEPPHDLRWHGISKRILEARLTPENSMSRDYR